MNTSERRQFFRTPCEVIIDCRTVDSYTAQHDRARDQFDETDDLALLAEFHQIDKQSQQLVRGLDSSQRNLLDYLELINRKVNCLAKSVIAQNQSLASLPRQHVNLSESGVCFESQRSLYKGSTLALRIVFLPHYLCVVLFAQVRRCESIRQKSVKQAPKDDRHHIAAEFLSLAEPERQLIAQQIMAAQLVAQRKAKDSQTPASD